MSRTWLAAMLVAIGSGSGCAETVAESNARQLSEWNQQTHEAEARRNADENAAIRRPIQPAPTLSYNLEQAANSKFADGPDGACETLARWRAWEKELPGAERERFKKHKERFGKNPGLKLAREDRDWPMILQYRLEDNVATTSEYGEAMTGVIAKPEEADIDRLKLAIAVGECAWVGGNLDKARKVLVSRTTVDPCNSSPSCIAQRERDLLDKVTRDICSDLSARRSAKEDARAEWRSAREVGVVNVQSLSDSKTQMEIADTRAAEGMDRYEQLTGKKFNSKTACR